MPGKRHCQPASHCSTAVGVVDATATATGAVAAAAAQKKRSKSASKSRAATATAARRSQSAPRTRIQASAGATDITGGGTQVGQTGCWHLYSSQGACKVRVVLQAQIHTVLLAHSWILAACTLLMLLCTQQLSRLIRFQLLWVLAVHA